MAVVAVPAPPEGMVLVLEVHVHENEATTRLERPGSLSGDCLATGEGVHSVHRPARVELGIAYWQLLGGAGADIINLSLAASFPRSCMDAPPVGQVGVANGCALLIAALNKTMAYAGSRGALVVSAAGNDAMDFDHSVYGTNQPRRAGPSIASADCP